LNGDAGVAAHLTLDGEQFVTASSVNVSEDEAYNTIIAVDKLLGRSLLGHKRLQANFVIAPGQFGYMCPGCSDTGKAMPAYWADEAGLITSAESDTLASQHTLLKILPWLSIVLIVLGVVVAVGAIAFCVIKRRENDYPSFEG
jgi:hypothetical protein